MTPVYVVTRKLDGVEITRYASSVILADDYPLAIYNHTVVDPAAPPPPSPRRITKLAFRQRFTSAEKITIELASVDVPDGQSASRQAAAQMRVWLTDIEVAQFIDLSYQPTREGVQALEDYGLIGIGRAAVILDTEPTAEERFDG